MEDGEMNMSDLVNVIKSDWLIIGGGFGDCLPP
jgi:hypothetical protein